MDTTKSSTIRGRKPRSLHAEIAAAAEKLRKLQDRQEEIDRKALARNQKAVMDLIKAKHLDSISITQWRDRITDIKRILTEQESAKPE